MLVKEGLIIFLSLAVFEYSNCLHSLMIKNKLPVNCTIRNDILFYVTVSFCSPAVVPEASKTLLSELPGVKTLEITAKYPTVEGTYKYIVSTCIR